MSKFPFRKPRIISKRFPKVDSTIDGVTESLQRFVFAYEAHVDRTLQKKHLMMAASSLALLIVLGSFIAPSGKAESFVFYPDTCLGGWVNPQYAQGKQQTTSNGDEEQFTRHNSAILPKNTQGEMYCGNFKGDFDQNTSPTKIIVSLALTKGPDLQAEDLLESGLLATTSPSLGDAASTTDTTRELLVATGTDVVATSTQSASSTDENSTTTQQTTEGINIPIVTGTSSTLVEETKSAIENIIDAVSSSVSTLFDQVKDTPTNTDTVVVPQETPPTQQEQVPQPSSTQETAPPQQAPVSDPASAPTSLLEATKFFLLSSLAQKVFAQESGSDVTSAPVVPPTPPAQDVVVSEPQSQSQSDAPSGGETSSQNQTTNTSTTDTSTVSSSAQQSTSQEQIIVAPLDEVVTSVSDATTTISTNTTTTDDTSATSTASEAENASSSSFVASSTEVLVDTAGATSTASSTESIEESQNNFLEVVYSFDGVVWTSLGELNEISMKYRTFEIPVTASTSWSDMSRLQIKVIGHHEQKETPTVYLDAVKVEVLYQNTLTHPHPDFARDTILEDITIDAMRLVRLVNYENKEEEVWYMYLEATSSSATTSPEVATSSVEVSEDENTTSTALIASSTEQEVSSSTKATSTLKIIPSPAKNIWMRWKHVVARSVPLSELVNDITRSDSSTQEEIIVDKNRVLDFAVDTIVKMKGVLSQFVVVQAEHGTSSNRMSELWLYDVTGSTTPEKIDTVATTTIALTSPIGVKEEYLFWISRDYEYVYAYNLLSKKVFEKRLPRFDASLGERAEIHFEEIKWKVIVSSEGFTFYSDATGEVFSDENSQIVEILRQKIGLDQVLDKEEMSNLSLPVEAPEEAQQP